MLKDPPGKCSQYRKLRPKFRVIHSVLPQVSAGSGREMNNDSSVCYWAACNNIARQNTCMRHQRPVLLELNTA